MQMDKRKPVIKEPVNDDNDRKYLQAEAQSDTEPFAPGSGSLPKLRKASEELKAKIADAKRRDDMPIESALGDPDWELNAGHGRPAETAEKPQQTD
jgi:hypothetical protein